MNAPIILAQLSGSQQTNNPNPPRNLKIEKPQNNQAVSIRLDGNTKLDFSDITSEKLTFVRVDERLIVLFDNQSTVTIDPMFDSNGNPLPNVSFEVGPDRIVDGTAFANLFPITTDQSVLPAAGAAAGGPAAGANFSNPNAGSLAGSGSRLALLGNEEGGGPNFGEVDPGNPQPIFNAIAVGNVDDEGLTEGNIGGPGDAPGSAISITNSLNVDFGTDRVGAFFLFSAVQPSLVGLTSGGQAIAFVILNNVAGGTPTLIGFIAGTDPNVAANQVFTVTLDNGPLNGAYTFTLFKPLDHLIANTEDTITLTISFTATDESGDTGTGSFGVAINDDSPVLALGQQQATTVDEDGLQGATPAEPNGNPGGTGDVAGTAVSATGTLGVLWGADNTDTADVGGVQDGAAGGTLTGRALFFTNTTVLVNGVATALTSHGDAVTYALSNANTTLTASAGGRVVFTVTLSDDGSGSYVFTLSDELDHPVVNTEDDLALQFNFTARDFDLDTIPGTFTVTVDDDTPIFSAEGTQSGTVNEDRLTSGNLGDTYQPSESEGEGPTESTVATGSLGILWGADNFDTADTTSGEQQVTRQDGAVDGSTINAQLTGRAVYFTNTTVGNSLVSQDEGPAPVLTSRGQVVQFRLDQSGSVLIGFVPGSGGGDDESPTIPERIVFTIALSDDGQGSYTLNLIDVLDHPVANAEDNINLTFNITARDFDGDTVASTVTVTVNDDAPVQGKTASQSVDEEVLKGGNAGEQGTGSGANADLDPNPELPVSGTLGIFWGADNDTKGDTLGDTFGRKVNFVTATGAGALLTQTDTPTGADLGLGTLKSDGVELAYKIVQTTTGVGGSWDGGYQLIAYKSTGSFDNASDQVFTVTLNAKTTNGSYEFKLLGNLDHPAPPSGTASEENDLALTFRFRATDADGDTGSAATFTVTVDDDAPLQVQDSVATKVADEDDLADFNPFYIEGVPVLGLLQGSLGTSPFDGSAPDQSITGLLGTVTVWGDLSPLVNAGADSALASFHLVSEAQAELLLATAGPNGGPLYSHGDAVDTAQFVNIPGVGEILGFFASDGRLVAGLFVGDEGTYNFRLFDQIDHPVGDDPETDAFESIQDVFNLDLSAFVQYSDGDGDTLTLKPDSFTVDIRDDAPEATGTETGLVNENDLADFNPLYPIVFDFLQGSLGTSPFDGFTDDGSITGLLGTVPVYGFLTDNIVGGADEFGKFDLVSNSIAQTLLQSMNLKSHGDVIDHTQSIDIPGLGEAMGFFASDGRLVFGLFVSEGGFYNFRLFDQLDHVAPTQPASPADGPVADINNVSIDLSKFVTFTDFDGDTIDLGTNRFVMTVVDDIPILTGQSVNVSLDEDDLSNFLPGWDLIPSSIKALFPVEGSAGTSPDSDTDALLLNSTGKQGFLNEIIGTNVVNGGADEFGQFGLVSVARADYLLTHDLAGWTSKGEAINHVQTLDLGLLGDVMGFFAGDRLVFTLTINPTGLYDIRLWDQVDHLGQNGQTITLDLSKFVTYTDFDGDTIDLGTGHLTLTVEDDAPEAVNTVVYGTVEDEQNDLLITALQGGDLTHGNEDTGSVGGDDLDTDGNPISLGSLLTSNVTIGSIAALVKVGADENGTFSFDSTVNGTQVVDVNGNAIKSHGVLVKFAFNGNTLLGFADTDNDGIRDSGERTVFTLTLAEIPPAGLLDGKVNDTFTFTLFDQIDHDAPSAANPSTEDTKFIDLSPTIKFTDADGDTTSLAPDSFQIKVIDDTPIQRAGQTVKGTVEEEHNVSGNSALNHGNEDQTPDPADADSVLIILPLNDFTTNKVSGNLSTLFSVGNDEVAQTLLLGIPIANHGNFALDSNVTGLTAQGLMSRGEVVTYAVTDVDGDGRGDLLTASAGGRPVFTLSLDNTGTDSGSYTFTLLDQLDHPGTGEDIKNIDFSSIIRFSDFDGDTIGLTAGSFTIDVIDDMPIFSSNPTAGSVDEEALNGNVGEQGTVTSGTGNADLSGAASTTGAVSLNISWGADDNKMGETATDTFGRKVNFARADGTLINDGATTAADLGLSATLTSDGVTLSYEIVKTLSVAGVWDGGYLLTAYKSTGSASNPADHVFTVKLDATAANGAYTFNIINNLDHPAPAANAGSENNIDLVFRVRPTDADGDLTTDSRTFTVTVDDDAPSQGTVTASSIDEESLTGGNDGEQGTGTGTNADLAGALTTTTGAVSLNISWGADSDKLGETATDTVIGRSVGFANASTSPANTAAILLGTVTAAQIGVPAGLSSDGVALTFTIVKTIGAAGVWDGGYQLIAHKGADSTIVANHVFTVTLDATATNGAYTFNLLGNLDHPSASGAAENDITLAFRVRAVDADGDVGAPQTITVTVDDDALAFGTIVSTLIDEESVPGIGGNAGGGNGDLDPNPGTDVAGPPASRQVTGTFGISWGSDDANTAVDGGFNGTVVNGDRSLTFASDAVSTLQGLGLKSDGVDLVYTLSNNNTLLTAAKTGGGATIFTVALSDQLTGSYTFKLFGNLDHATETAPGTENDTVLTIKVTARDGDGDATNAQFTVTVDDDAPTFTAANVQNRTVDDEGLTGGNAGEPSSPASYVGSDFADTPTSVSGNLGVSWGADDNNTGTANRSLAFRDLVTNGAITNGSNVLDSTGAVVKSHGLDVKYFVADIAGLPTLIGYTGSDPNVVANQVFKVTLDDTVSTGLYSFQLIKPFDHPVANTEDDRTLNFGFIAKDADGDSVNGSFSVTVDDDAPIINANNVQNGTIDEERLPTGNANGDGTDMGSPQDDGDLTATGALGISFGSDGPADVVGSAPTNTTVNFDNVPQGPLPSPALTVGTYSFTSNQGIANHTGVAGQLYGTNINVTNSAGPFTVSTLSLGLFGTSLTGDGQVRLTGTPAAGGAPIVVVLSGIVTAGLGSPISSFNLSSTALAGVQLSALKIEPVLPGPTTFNGSVVVDNIALGSGGGGISDGPVTFTDQSVASNNVTITDGNNNPVNLATLTSDGQPVLFKLLDAMTLVAYTGSAPTSINDANVVFSAVLSNTGGSGNYTFVVKNNLDHPITGAEDDLVITLKYAAKDFDGDKQDGTFKVTVDDDVPVATATVLSGAVFENELSTATGDVSTGTQAGNTDNKNATANTDDTILTGSLASLVSVGADAPGTFLVEATNLSSSLTSLTSHGVPLAYTLDGNKLVAMAGNKLIFTLEVDAATGNYTFTLTGPIDHFGAGGGTVTLAGVQVPLTAVDQLGEIYTTSEISGNSLAFEGRLPNGDVIIKVTNHSNSPVSWVLDNTDGGTDYPLSIAANTTIFINVGPFSTPPNVKFELTGDDAPGGNANVNSGHGLIVTSGSGGGSEQVVLDLSSAVTVRDGDGDTVALGNQLLITVNDDAPVLNGTPTDGAVNEAGIPIVLNAMDVKPLLISFGADGPNAHLTFARDSSGNPLHPAGITSDDVPLQYEIRLAGSGEEQLVAFKQGETVNEPVFIVELTSPPNPNYVFTLYQNLDHFGPNDTSLSLGFSIVATDFDGDSVTRNVTVKVADDVIAVGAAPALGVVDEDERISSVGNIATETGVFTFDFGNDEAGALAVNPAVSLAGLGGDGLLRSNGQLVSYGFVGSVLVGYTGATVPSSITDASVVFSVELSTAGTGSYTFTLRQALDHSGSPAGTPITMTFSVTGSDGDGDTAPTSFAIRLDPAGSISSINYSNLTTGVFVNLADASTTVGSQTVAANTATDNDNDTATVDIVGNDNVAGIVDALGGSGDDILVGGAEANTLTGNGGKDILDGGAGSDLLVGNAGDDTFVLHEDVAFTGTRQIQLGDGTQRNVSLTNMAGTADITQGGADFDTIVLDRGGRNGYIHDTLNAPSFLDSIEKIEGTSGNDFIVLSANYTSGAANGGINLEGGAGDDYLGGGAGADLINGGADNDVISGLGGDDTLNGDAGTDEIWGGAGVDTVHGGADNDTIMGNAGNDLLFGDGGDDKFVYNPGHPVAAIVGDGSDTVDGGAGTDTLHINRLTSEQNRYYVAPTGNAGEFTVTVDHYGVGPADVITIKDVEKIEIEVKGNEQVILQGDLTGLSVDVQGNGEGSGVFLNGLQAITAVTGNLGDGGDEVYGGNHTTGASIDGGAGVDNLYYNLLSGPVNADLATGAMIRNGGAVTDTMTNFENLTGTSFNDTLRGSDVANEINGGDGNDLIEGRGGADTLNGGTGNDRIIGGGEATVNGGFKGPAEVILPIGSTALTDLGGGWTVTNGTVDLLFVPGSLGSNFPAGVNAVDMRGVSNGTISQTFATVVGTTYTVTFLQAVNADIDVHTPDNAASVTLSVNAADPQTATFTATSPMGTVWGNVGQTFVEMTYTFTADSTSTTLSIASVPGNGDQYYGALIAEVFVAPNDPADLGDTINGGDGNDVIHGGAGADLINGDANDDLILGGAGGDTINGGTGNDFISGGLGDDTISGGDGDDVFVHRVGDGNDTIDGGTETGSAFPNYDVLEVYGDGTPRTFTLGTITGGAEIGSAASVDLSLTYTGGGSVRADEVERVVFNVTGNDTIVIGDLTNTAISPNTIVINSTGGNNVIDLTQLKGTSVVVLDSDPVASGDIDKVILSGDWEDYTASQNGNTFTVFLNGAPVVTTTNVETFQFDDGTIPVGQLVNVAPVAGDDVDTVIEAGGVNNTTLGDNTSTGNVLGNDNDANTLDTEKVVSVTFGANTVAVPSDGSDASITGTYGTLVIHANGTYTYTLNDTDTDTNKLPVGAPAADTFTYTMQDHAGLQDTADLKINITGANDNPVAQNDVITGSGGAIRVAVIGSDGSDVNGAVGQLNDDTYFNFTATGFKVANYATKAEWDAALAGYDVVVIGNSGSGEDSANSSVYASLKDFVDAGHGVVSTGWYSFALGRTTGSQTANADYISPVAAAGGDYDYYSNTTFSIDSSHPITNGVSSITVGSGFSYWERAAAVDANATVLAPSSGSAAIAYSTLAGGAHLAYLGGIYLGATSYTLGGLRTGNADRLLEQAVNWSANGAGAGTAITEDATFTIQAATLLANDSDVDTGDVLTIQSVTNSTMGAVVTLNPDGSVSYNPTAASQIQALAEGATATDTFTYTVSDGHGGTSTATVSLTVTGKNDAPALVDDNVSVSDFSTKNAGTVAAQGSVLTNDTDAEGDTLSIVTIRPFLPNPIAFSPVSPGVDGVAQGTYGVLVIKSDGTYTYTANAAFDALKDGQTAQDVFKYGVDDGNGGQSTAYLTFNITGTNDTPVAVADSNGVNEDETVTVAATGVLLNDADADGDTLSVLSVGLSQSGPFTSVPVGGSAVIEGTYGHLTIYSDGSYSYVADKPEADALTPNSGTVDGFTYVVTDSNGATTSDSLRISVFGVNDAPVALNDSYSVNEDNTLTVTALLGTLNNDTDVDSASKTAVLVNSPAHGTLILNPDGSFTYTPNANYFGPDSFTYKANDGLAASNVATVYLTINAVNDNPVAVNDSYTTNEDTALNIVAPGVLGNDSDVDGDPLAVTVTNVPPAHGTLTQNANGSFTYTPDANYNGSDSFTYTVSDGHGGTSTATVNLTINPVNDAPNTPTDTDNAVNSVAENAANGTPVGLTVNATDIDGDTVTYSLLDNAGGRFAINSSTGVVSVANGSLLDFESATSHQIVVRATDTSGAVSDRSFTIGVTDVNEAPPNSNPIITSNRQLAAVFEDDTRGTQIIVNGSFESQNIPAPGTTAFTGWTVENSQHFYPYNDGPLPPGESGIPVVAGSVSLAAYKETDFIPVNIAQTVTTTAGQNYQLGFWVRDPSTGNGRAVEFTVKWNGQEVLALEDYTGPGALPQGWTHYTVGVVGAAGSSTLQFESLDQFNFVLIDGVTLSASGAAATNQTADGVINFTDANAGDTHTASFVPQGAGYLGTFSLDPVNNAADSVGWHFTVSNAALQVLAQGETRTQTYTVTVDDGHGGTASQIVVISIGGADEGTSVTGNIGAYYAFSQTLAAPNAAQPTLIDFDADSIFGGGSDTFNFTFAAVSGFSAGTGINLIQAADGVVKWDPNNVNEIAVYRIDAVDKVTGESNFAYVAFSALNNAGRFISITNSQVYTNASSNGDVVFVDPASTVASTTSINGDSQADVLIGNNNGNTLNGNAQSDALYGMGGDDVLKGESSSDYLSGGAGNDNLDGGAQADVLDGGDGDDTLFGDSDGDILIGGAGVDTMDGGNGADTIYGGSGNDILRVTDNADLLFDGGSGDDTLRVETSNLTAGNYTNSQIVNIETILLNVLPNNSTNFAFTTQTENLIIRDGTANGGTTAQGGSGNDTFIGGAGIDTFTGNLGADRFVYAETGAANKDVINGYSAAQGDVIDLSALLGNLGVTGANISQYVKLTQSASGVNVAVDLDGNGAGGPADVAFLQSYGTVASPNDVVKIALNNIEHQMTV